MSNPGRVTPDPFDHQEDHPQQQQQESSSSRQYGFDTQLLPATAGRVVEQPLPADVVVSSGWVRNPGNAQFRSNVQRMANSFKAADPSGKVLIAQLLVYTVQDTNAGRFLRKTSSGGWRLASAKESLQTSFHALLVASSSMMHLPSCHRRQNNKALLCLKTAQGSSHQAPLLQEAQHASEDHRSYHNNISQTRPQAGTGAVSHDTERADHQRLIALLPQQRRSNSSSMAWLSLQDVTRALQENNELSLASSSSLSLRVEVKDASDADVRAFCCAMVAASRLHQQQQQQQQHVVVRSLHMMLSPQLSFASAKQLALAIRRCRGLDTLQIDFHGAKGKFALLLVAAAIGNPFVTTLFLNGNRLGDKGALWIANILHRCPRSNVQCISLENNDISTVGAMALRRVLQEESTVTGRRIRVALGDGGGTGCFVLIPNDDECHHHK